MKRGRHPHEQAIPKIAFKGVSCSSFLWNTYVGCQHAQSLQKMNCFSLSLLAACCSNAWMLALPPAQHGLQSPHFTLLSKTGISTFPPGRWLAVSLKNSPWRAEKFWGSLASDYHKQQHLTSQIQLPRLGCTVVGSRQLLWWVPHPCLLTPRSQGTFHIPSRMCLREVKIISPFFTDMQQYLLVLTEMNWNLSL